MSTRLPADLRSRKRLDGTYKLRVAAVQDICQPKYSTDHITTVHGATARHMPADEGEEEGGIEVSTSKKRLLKLVLADSTDRLLVGYEYEKWESEAAEWVQHVGNQVEIVGPVVLEQGAALLSKNNVTIPHSIHITSGASAKPAVLVPQNHTLQDDWIHNLPSDLFAPSTDDVIIIDE